MVVVVEVGLLLLLRQLLLLRRRLLRLLMVRSVVVGIMLGRAVTVDRVRHGRHGGGDDGDGGVHEHGVRVLGVRIERWIRRSRDYPMLRHRFQDGSGGHGVSRAGGVAAVAGDGGVVAVAAGAVAERRMLQLLQRLWRRLHNVVMTVHRCRVLRMVKSILRCR